MEQTQYCQLSLWDGEDRILREDFNGDNAKIDAALKAEAEARAAGDDAEAAAREALAAQVAKLGNCQIWTTTYTGTGTSGKDHPTRVTFPKKPLLAAVSVSSTLAWLPTTDGWFNTPKMNELSWSGSTASWYFTSASVTSETERANNQLNYKGQIYRVVALMAADE